MNENPLVSVLMTVYNREKYIAEAIKSVIKSTYKNWELIIVDDGSSDNSFKIAQQYIGDERIKLYQNEKNLGQFANRNKAAEYATGKYIKYLDSDDLIYAHGLEVMVKTIEQFPVTAYAMSYAKVHENRPYPFLLTPEEAYKEHFLQRGLFNEGPTSIIFDTEIFKKEGGFKEFKVYGDTEILLRLSAKYSMIKMQPSLTWWRQHDGQEFNLGYKNDEYFNGTYLLSMKFLENENCPLNKTDKLKAIKRLKQHHARKILSIAIKEKKIGLARKYFRSSHLSFKELLLGLKAYS